MSAVQPFIDKALFAVLSPLGLGLLLVLLAALCPWRGRARRATALSAAALAVLWIASSPFAARRMADVLERPFPPVAAGDLPAGDAIVLLGGAVTPLDRSRGLVNVGAAFDRVLFARSLFAAGRAPVIVVTGGSLTGGHPEAEAIARQLEELGIPARALVLETASRTTRENALGAAEILSQRGARRVLLVTSALHMARALATFRSAGIEAFPAPTDHQVAAEGRGLLDGLPSPDALVTFTAALKEQVGLLVYRLRGWAI